MSSNYLLLVSGSTEEPLRNISLMSLADIIEDQIPGFKVNKIEMTKGKEVSDGSASEDTRAD